MIRQAIVFAALAVIAPYATAQQNIPTAVGDNNANPAVSSADGAPATPAESTGSGTSLSELILDIESARRGTSAPPAGSAYTPEQQAAYNEWVLSYTRGAYGWHQLSTIIIFFVVISVVLSGVVLAAWQLRSWLRRLADYDKVFLSRLEQGHEVRAELIAETGKSGSHELNLQSKAVALTTPYVGVVILGLSMGFFLAYLLLVYPILQGP